MRIRFGLIAMQARTVVLRSGIVSVQACTVARRACVVARRSCIVFMQDRRVTVRTYIDPIHGLYTT